MTGGITPIDHSFELIGLHQCSALLRFIFIETLAGKVVFVMGFIFSLVQSLKTANFRQVIIFCAVFFFCLFLLVIPRTTMPVTLSTMEERGFNRVTTESIIREAGVGQMMASPVLVTVSKATSAFTNSAISVVDLARSHHVSFLKEPFIAAKLCLLTRELLKAGINDSSLKERLLVFYQDYYYPSLRTFMDKKPVTSDVPWVGSEDMLKGYSTTAASDWKTLEEALYASVDRDGMFSRVSRDFYEGSSLKDAAVRALIEADAAHVPLTYSALSFTGDASRLKVRGTDLKGHAAWLTEGNSLAWLSWYPVVYGACLWGLWAAFPFVLVFIFLGTDIGLLGVFLKYYFLVKLIPFFYALIDRVIVLVFDIQTQIGGGKILLWDMPLGGMVVGLGTGVVVMYLFIVFKRKGVL